MSSRYDRKHNKPKRDYYKSTNDDESADTPIMKLFRKYREILDDKNDRNERIVKASRDITIESKRIIFLLHNIDSNK
jgi:hypothetical protein